MKKMLLFFAFTLFLGACMGINYKKNASIQKNVPEVEPEESYPNFAERYMNQAEWEEYHKFYGEEEQDTTTVVVTDTVFKRLLQLFPKGNLPYNLSADVLLEQFNNTRLGVAGFPELGEAKRNVLPREFRKYFPTLDRHNFFTRMAPAIGEPFLAFEAQDKYVLVYFTRRGAYFYQVATFTKQGQLISERHFAHAVYNDISAVNLDENLNLTSTEYKVIWDKEPDGRGYKNAKITGLKLKRKTIESLSKEGREKELPLENTVIQKTKP